MPRHLLGRCGSSSPSCPAQSTAVLSARRQTHPKFSFPLSSPLLPGCTPATQHPREQTPSRLWQGVAGVCPRSPSTPARPLSRGPSAEPVLASLRARGLPRKREFSLTMAPSAIQPGYRQHSSQPFGESEKSSRGWRQTSMWFCPLPSIIQP